MKREEMVCINCIYYVGQGQADEAGYIPIVCRYEFFERRVYHTGVPQDRTPVTCNNHWCNDGSWLDYTQEGYKRFISWGEWDEEPPCATK